MIDDSFAQVFTGVVAGFAATLATLFIFHYIFAASIEFSRDVRVFWPKSRTRPRYSVKLRKSGLIDLVDTQIHCNLYISDVAKTNSDIQNVYRIPTTFDTSLRMKQGTRTVHLSIQKNEKVSNPTSIYLKRFVTPVYPEVGIRFEDIFRFYQDAYVRIFVLGHDRFTGVKKLYESPRYYFHNFRRGDWEGLHLIWQ